MSEFEDGKGSKVRASKYTCTFTFYQWEQTEPHVCEATELSGRKCTSDASYRIRHHHNECVSYTCEKHSADASKTDAYELIGLVK